MGHGVGGVGHAGVGWGGVGHEGWGGNGAKVGWVFIKYGVGLGVGWVM